MSKTLVKREYIQMVESVEDWKEAIALSIRPLLEHGDVEPRYVDEIIKNTIEMGPYYLITEDVALIHGRPEQGVIRGQVAVTVLKDAVTFLDEEHSARILITLAAENANSHIDVMKQIATVLMDDDAIKKILDAKSEDEIETYLCIE